MEELGRDPFPDAIGICLSRIILEHFDRTDFLVALIDSDKVNFLNKDPKYRKIGCPQFFSPAFVKGSVHFSSMMTGVLSRSVYTPNWIKFF